MGETVIEKIIRNNVGKTVKPGDIVTVNVDRVMIHDIFIPFVAEKFKEMGFTKLWDPDKAVLIYDHLVPASQLDDTRHFHAGDAFARKYGMKNVHRSDGICHQLMTEAGYVKPGNIVFGTDSHTTTYGCVGAFSSGIGYTEMASILGTGTMWIKVPETIKVVIEGELPGNVMSKDIILRLIGDLGADGATYRALEFTGSTVKNMTVASRMTMANMAIEAGAKCALFTPDEKTAEYCDIELNEFQKSLTGDEDATYMKTITYRAEDFVPVMACPSQVDKIRDVSELQGETIDQVFIGSCTNGRIQDIRQAAQLHSAAPHCQLRLDVVAKLPAALKGHRLKGQGTLQHRVRQVYSVQGLLCPALHPQGFGANPLHILFGLLRIPLSSRQLRRGKDHRQRCFQLMGRI